jgi:hypothetical protein
MAVRFRDVSHDVYVGDGEVLLSPVAFVRRYELSDHRLKMGPWACESEGKVATSTKRKLYQKD